MYKQSDIARLEFVLSMIENIQTITRRHEGIVAALNDESEGQLALLMCLEQIGETLKKLQTPEILEHFDRADIKGAYDVRLFIVHDYEGVNLALIERIIREKIPVFKETILSILEKNR